MKNRMLFKIKLAFVGVFGISCSAGNIRSVSLPGSNWKGTYFCNQGETGLQLKFANHGGNTVKGEFIFSPTSRNPAVPHGRFTIKAIYNPNTRDIRIQDGDWIDQPSGYVTVGLIGKVSSDGSTMKGSVDGPGCGEFEVEQQP